MRRIEDYRKFKLFDLTKAIALNSPEMMEVPCPSRANRASFVP